MVRNSVVGFRFFSVKSIASILLVLTALVLPACQVGGEEGVTEEEIGEEEMDEEEMDEEEEE